MGWTAHDTDLYALGGGIAMFDRFDSDGLPTGLLDLGNTPAFALTPSIEEKKHLSTRGATQKVDLIKNVLLGLMVKFTIDEYDKANLALALYGTVSGNDIILLDVNSIEGELRFYGNPTSGPKLNFYAWKVNIKSTGDIPLINTDWGPISLEAEIIDDTDNHPDNPNGLIQQIIGS